MDYLDLLDLLETKEILEKQDLKELREILDLQARRLGGSVGSDEPPSQIKGPLF